jgi:hypothetical protein
MDYKPIAETIGQTLNIAIPQDPTNSVADQGSGDPVFTDIGFTTVGIVFNQHPAFNYIIRDFEQFNSADDVRNVFLDAALKGVKSYINGKITALFTTGNFATNTAISTTAHLITTAQFLQGYAVLADKNVPVADDPDNMSLILPSTPYATILGDANWTQAQIAGERTADAVRSSGTMPMQYGMTLKLDQQMPTSGASPSRTFTAAYLHKWAVAMATRPLQASDPKTTYCTYVQFGGVPIRIVLAYLPQKGGWAVMIDAGFGLKVVRPEMCQLFTIAE